MYAIAVSNDNGESIKGVDLEHKKVYNVWFGEVLRVVEEKTEKGKSFIKLKPLGRGRKYSYWFYKKDFKLEDTVRVVRYGSDVFACNI